MVPSHFIIKVYVHDAMVGTACFLKRGEGEAWAYGAMAEYTETIGAEAMADKEVNKPVP